MQSVKWEWGKERLSDSLMSKEISDLNIPLWKDTVSVIARGEISNKLAPFYMRHYHSKHFWWDDDMDKEFRTRIEGELSIS